MKFLDSRKARSIALGIAIAIVLVVSLLPAQVGISTAGQLSVSVRPVSAQDLIAQEIKRATTEYTESVVYNQDGTFTKVVTTLPKRTQDGTLISCQWTKKGDSYVVGHNLYQATVTKNKVTITFDGDSMSWAPVVSLDGKTKNCGAAKILDIDPFNENYQNNVLEWDYGFCKRQLRIIEGALLEYYVFATDPGGDLDILENTIGKVGNVGYYAIDAKGEDLEGFTIKDDTKHVPASAFKGVSYPVIVDSSVTVYSTSADGRVRNSNVTYATCQSAGTGDVVDTTETGSWVSNRTGYRINRFFVYFACGLTVNATVTGGTTSIYGYAGSAEPDAGHSDVWLYEGLQAATLTTADFDSFQTTNLMDDNTVWQYPLGTAAYTDAVLNTSGIAVIEAAKTGTAKFCLRSSGDVNAATPTGINGANFYTNEKGVGYQPRLVITYHIPNISEAESSHDFGYVLAGQTYTTGLTHMAVTNNGDAAVSISISGTDMTSAQAQQTESGSERQLGLAMGSSCIKFGQKLTFNNTVITELSFYLKKTGTISGDVTFTIRRTSDDSLITSKVWGDASSLPTSLTWEKVTFDSPVWVNEEVRLLVEFSGLTSSGDVRAAYKSSDVKASECETEYWTGPPGAYSDQSTYDACYKYSTTDWTLAASVAANTYALKAGLSGGDYTIEVKKTSPNNLTNSLGAGNTQQWGLKFYAPSSTTDYIPKSGTITLTASIV